VTRPVQAGDLLLWEPGEEHETIAEEPMVLLIVEADALTIPAVEGCWV
jgi:quercetin dioxygenase-like cupin family protein